MWYLDDSFKYILLMAVTFCLVNLVHKKTAQFIRKYVFPFVFAGFLFYYSRAAALFYCGYLLIIILLANLIRSIQKEGAKKWLFSCSVLLCTILFVIINVIPSAKIQSLFSDTAVFIGASYAFLKFVDILFFAYYYDDPLRFLDIAGYILFTPVLTSGPIIMLGDYKKQIDSPLPAVNFETPVKRIIIGFFKKVVLVKFIYIAHDYILGGELNAPLSFLVLFLFYIIGYLDFSGYSDIAIGFGALLGISVPENFKMPFLSPSLTIFWKNWHISLGTWVKGHISVFLKPKNRLMGGLTSFIIMLFIGVWHKFSLLFFCWGAWHGIFLFIEGYFNIGIVNKKKTKKSIYYVRCLLTNITVTLGCLFFYTDMDTVIKICKGFFTL